MLSDLRFSFRQLTKAPAFAAVAILTLALCIGANSAIFSVVNAILLKPYPWPDSERLVYVYNTYPLAGLENAGVAVPDYLDRREGVNGLADAAMYHGVSFNLGGASEPERLVGMVATPSLFTTLRTGAALGRVFTDEEAQPGQTKVVVLSHALWKNRFGADPDLVGQTIRLNTEPVTVVGVMPDGFYFPSPRVQAWVPFAFTSQQRSDDERGTEFSSMIARLNPGASLAAVQRELDVIQVRNAERLPQAREFWKTSGFGGRVAGFLETNVGGVRNMLWLVQAGVAAALLIGCANVANLLLTRAVSRERELAIRSALGAGRGRLIRLLLTESVVLFLVGGTLGLVVALWGVGLLADLGLSGLPRAFGVDLDFSVFAVTLVGALAAGLVFGALPAWTASRQNANTTLKEAGSRTTAGRRTQWMRAGLVVSEIAITVMLLSTSGLLVKSFARLQEQDTGFAPGGVITAQLDLPRAKYDHPDKIATFHDTAVAALRALPGVRAVGVTTALPFSGNTTQGSYTSPDFEVAAGAPLPHANVRQADPGYLHALGLTLLRGRWFGETDSADAQHVVVVDRLLAERYWPGQDPLGKRISRNIGSTDPKDLWTIVGVVAPTKIQSLEEDVRKETIYFPLAQQSDTSLMLVVKTDGNPAPLAAGVRAAVHRADPEQPVFDVKTMVDRIADSAQPRHAPMVLLALFSGVALLLAALGVYGVLAFSVEQRTAEFGIRFALGATPRNVVALVLRQAASMVLLGIIAGVAGYLALSRIVAGLLYDVSAADPATLIIAPLVLAVVAFAATLVPVRRASRVDPLVALRTE